MTATAIVQQQGNGAHELSLTREQIELVKQTVCKEGTDAELQLFLHTARRLGLDPLAKQIHAVFRYDKKAGRRVMSIQTAIDGFRLVAQRTREADGQDGPFWCGEDGVWRDVWLSEAPPSAAKVVVWRKGQNKPYTGIATFKSYCQRYEGNPQGLWSTMPDNQLAKCAEALAQRKAFPAELSGVHAPEEMEQADNVVVVTQTRPALTDPINQKLQDTIDAPADDVDPEDFAVKGKGGRSVKLSELDDDKLEWLINKGAEQESRYAALALQNRREKVLAERAERAKKDDMSGTWVDGAPAAEGEVVT